MASRIGVALVFQIVKGKIGVVALSVACATFAIAALPSQAVDSPPARRVLEPVPIVDATAPAPTRAGIAPKLKPALPSSTKVAVIDPSTESLVYGREANSVAIPASTLKIITSASVLTALGPNARVSTRVVREGKTLTLVGGGDPTLVATRAQGVAGPTAGGPAALSDLVDEVVSKLPARATVRVKYDASLFTGPTLGPGWSRNFPAAGIAAPVSALVVDGARVSEGSLSRVADPARQAGDAFAELLRGSGVSVRSVGQGVAPKEAESIAAVDSMTIADMVERAETDSDNDVAEALARLAGVKRNGDGSFAGGAQAAKTALDALGIPTNGITIVDGSGLSGENKVAPSTIASVLSKASRAQPAELWPILSGLAVAGLTGTMMDRMNTQAAGYVRAKTGTLIGVNALAGTVRDADGRVIVFSFLASNVSDVLAVRSQLDDAASVLAYCGCS